MSKEMMSNATLKTLLDSKQAGTITAEDYTKLRAELHRRWLESDKYVNDVIDR